MREQMTDLISRAAAIDLVRDICVAVMSGCESLYDSETEDEVYKDIREVDAILKCNKEVRIALRNMPSAEPEIVRCKDCIYRDTDDCKWRADETPDDDDYCSIAERVEDDI